MSIRECLETIYASGRSALIPYLTAGVPDMPTSFELLKTLSAAGADVIELGVPFSDPVADGPVIQKASEQALANGVNLQQILELVSTYRQAGFKTPIILFSYYNPIYCMGLDAFATAAKAAGVTGVLVVDLLPEAAAKYISVMKTHQLETVFLVAPTTAAERLPVIAAASSGCVYYVSRTGVTGERSQMADDLPQRLNQLRQTLRKPVIVGFGISTPEHVKGLNHHAEGIVVGSALMSAIAQSPEKAVKSAHQLIADMAQVLNA